MEVSAVVSFPLLRFFVLWCLLFGCRAGICACMNTNVFNCFFLGRNSMSPVSSPPPAISRQPEIARLWFGPTKGTSSPNLAVQAEMSPDCRISGSKEAEKGLWETREMILSNISGEINREGGWRAGEKASAAGLAPLCPQISPVASGQATHWPHCLKWE